MVTITVKHIKPGHTRDFNGLRCDSATRSEWIRENKDKYMPVAEITFFYCTRQKAMNLCFEATNSFHQYWVDEIQNSFDDEKFKIYPFNSEIGGHRSTSVGDIFTIKTEHGDVDYFVDSSGFTPLAEDSFSEEA